MGKHETMGLGDEAETGVLGRAVPQRIAGVAANKVGPSEKSR